ncbi:hypothetical protein ACWEKR_16265, partial [Nocardia sp. NPDC004573]
PAQLKTETTNPTGQVVQIELPSDGPDWRSVDNRRNCGDSSEFQCARQLNGPVAAAVTLWYGTL